MSSQFDSVLDVTGVEGAAFIDVSGSVIVRNMPSLYTDEILIGISNRCKSINAALGSALPGCDRILLRFMHKSVYLRANRQGVLLVIGDISMSQSGLSVATHILLSSGLTPETIENSNQRQKAPQATPPQSNLSNTHVAQNQPIPNNPKPAKKTRSGIWG
ncbi:MAG: hypothetical protein AAF649_04120 [Verrucomicrobiota bacterium]